jgi:hypothetical protein
MKTHSRILSGQLRLAAVLFALFLLPIGAAAQAGNSSQDRTQTVNAGITGSVLTPERKEADLNTKLRIRSGRFFLKNPVLSKGRIHAVSASSPFTEVMLGNANSGDYVTLYSGGSERARIATNGNVGIGTTDPTTPLTNAGWGGSGLTIGNTNSGTTSSVVLVSDPASSYSSLRFGSGTSSVYDQGFLLYNHSANFMSFGTSRGTRMTIDAGGNVGVGTTGPYTRLHVSTTTDADGIVIANPTATNGTRASLYLSTENSTPALGNVSVEAVSVSQAYPDMVFRTLGLNAVNAIGTERMRITSSGNVGIGTPGPNRKLEVGSVGSSIPSSTAQIASEAGIGAASGNKIIYLFNNGSTIKLDGYDYGTNAPLSVQLGGNGSIVTSAAAFASVHNLGLPPTVGGAVYITGGYASPDSGRFIFGDGSGWKMSFSKRSGGTTTDLVTIQDNGNLNVSGSVNAKYQDVAEWVPSSEQLTAGTVVVLDSTKSNQVISSTTSYDTRVAGVISEQPGIALGEKSEGKVLVATTGRVRVKVYASKGPIRIGDLLVTSDIPGVAMRSEPVKFGGRKMHMPGTVIGKALEPLQKGKGEILVLLSLQ